MNHAKSHDIKNTSHCIVVKVTTNARVKLDAPIVITGITVLT